MFMMLVVALASAQGLQVALFFVDLTGVSADTKFFACGDHSRAGPFMSAGTAIEWRNDFPDASVRSPDRIKSG
jgi:hypothetical protein